MTAVTERFSDREFHVGDYTRAVRVFGVVMKTQDASRERAIALLGEEMGVAAGQCHPFDARLRAGEPKPRDVMWFPYKDHTVARVPICYTAPPRIDYRVDIRRRWAAFN